MDQFESRPQPGGLDCMDHSRVDPMASLLEAEAIQVPKTPTSLGSPILCGSANLATPPSSACFPIEQQVPADAASSRSAEPGLLPPASLNHPEAIQEKQSEKLPPNPLVNPVDSQVQTVEVICGPVSGIFCVDPPSILLKENGSLTRRISPTEMERLGGKESNKKWKSTLKVLDSKGQPGKPIGDWLKTQGIELKAAQRKSRNKSKRSRAASTSCLGMAQPALGSKVAQVTVQGENEMRARIEMEAHLGSCHLGYRPSDPDCAELPVKFEPVDNRPGIQEINLSKLSYEQLLILARANGCPDGGPDATLLAHPPGILVDREAYVSGHEPKRRNVPREQAEGLTLMGEYLSGQRPNPPVEAFGADRIPKFGEKEVDLRQLYNLVRLSGGFDQVNGSRKWPVIADSMGLNGGLTMSMGYGLRSVYQRFLLRFERQERSLHQFGEVQALTTTTTDATASKGSKDDSNVQEAISYDDDGGKRDSLFQCTFSGSSLSSLKDTGEVDENNTRNAQKMLLKCPIAHKAM